MQKDTGKDVRDRGQDDLSALVDDLRPPVLLWRAITNWVSVAGGVSGVAAMLILWRQLWTETTVAVLGGALLLVLSVVVSFLILLHREVTRVERALSEFQSTETKRLSHERLLFFSQRRLGLDGTITIHTRQRIRATEDGLLRIRHRLRPTAGPAQQLEIRDMRPLYLPQGVQLDMRVVAEGPQGADWFTEFSPPLKEGDEAEFEYTYVYVESQVLTLERLAAASRVSPEVSNQETVRTSVETELLRLQTTFPPGYRIRRQAPRVEISGKRLIDEEQRLMKEGHFKAQSTPDGCVVEIEVRDPQLFAEYGFTWDPPSEEEYQTLLQQAPDMTG